MSFIYASAAWLIMAFILGLGILLAAKGSLWLLIISAICFILAVGKIGCAVK